MNLKKILASVLACCVIGGTLPYAGGKTVDNAVITASASEHTYEQLTYENCGNYIQITDCDESATEVVIPSEIVGLPVTTIFLGAFADCSNLTSVEIPDSVTYIDDMAFLDCTNLKSINIPDSVTTITDYTFANCTSLEEITIPDSVTNIGEMAFYCCTNLKSIKIPDGVSTINKFTFGNCSSLAEIIIPDSATDINNTAFSNTLWLEEKQKENPLVTVNNILIDGTTCEGVVVVPDGIIQICFSAFKKCTSLEEITIPDSVKEIEFSVFEGCTSLKSINLPNSITKICFGAFENCTSLEEITIPDSVNEIESHVFEGCKNLKSINIPDGVTKINDKTFKNCSSLEEIIIPDSVTSIGESAFFGCNNLKSVTLPDSIESIGDDAFANTPWLEEKKKENSLFIVNNVLIDGTNCEGEAVIPDGVTRICNNAFKNCSSLEKIIIPGSVKKIGDYAFESCKNLKSVNIQDGVTTIGDYAFSNCSSLEEIIIPDSVKEIGRYAFNNCKNLKSVDIQGSFIAIGRYAFSNCSSLEKLILPDNVSIYDGAFSKCENLKDVYYTGSLLNIFNTNDNDSLLSVIGDKLNFGDPLQYSYEITPCLEPFQDYFYVKTDNPNPVSFRFIDKESVYKNNSTIDIYKTVFSDVKYENLQTLRVNGGYIFKSDNTDGGTVTLQTKVNEEWNDTDIILTLPTLYDDCDYLINTYAKKDNFFDNMSAVEFGLHDICFYSGSFIRGELVRKFNFWSMSSYGYADQLLYIYSPYNRKDNKPLFASMVYPFRYDSIAFPSMMAIVSQRLDSSSAYYWDDYYHYLINVTYNGETRSYGGQGWIKGQGISEDKIKRFFTFDENDEEITFENIKQLLVDYSGIEMEDDIPRDDELTWADVCHTVNDGAWVKSPSTKYTYLYKLDDEESYSSTDFGFEGHKMYIGGSLGYTSDTWVDGRYISLYREYVKGETFDKHPESDILLSQVTVPELKDYNYKRTYNSDTEKYEYVYSDIEIGETVKTVKYKYDSADKIWKANLDEYNDEYNTIVDMVNQKLIDEKYLDMIQLTPDEVKVLEVDRNTNIEPDHYYIYDGTVEPGTEFFAGTEEVTTTTSTTSTTTTTTSTTTTTIPPTTTTSTTTTTIPPTTTTSTTTTTIPPTTTTLTTTTTIPTTTTTSTTVTTNSTTSTTEPINQAVFGDVNDDGIVDANDASAVLAEYADFSTGGSGTFSDEQKSAGDVNSDDIIDANDASAILAFYAYLSTGGTEKDMRVWLDM